MDSLSNKTTDHIKEDLLNEDSISRAVLDACPVPCALNDDFENITYLNRAFIETLGYTLDDVPTLSDWWPKAYPDQEYRELVATTWQAHIDAVKNGGGNFEPMEINIRSKNGKVLTMMVSAASLIGKYQGTHLVILYDITRRKEAEDLIWKHANFDIITGLPNRRLLYDRLGRDMRKAKRNNEKIALLFIDLDRFKEVNDTLGHAKGDVLLVEAAHRISKCVRDTDTVSRQGGDEFTVVLSDLSGSRLDEIVQEILNSLSQPFQISGGDVVYISASIGITLFPDDATDITELMKNADQAMYVAKAGGRNCFSYFVPSLQTDAQEKLNLTNDLRLALSNNELEIYYQPIVDRNGEINKAEALLRWNHPSRGLVGPFIFIPLAEDSGLIHEIGEWVFQEVLSTIEHWYEAFGRYIQISVNKSPVQFERSGRRHWMDRMINSNLPANSITVEITEGLMIKDSSRVKDRLLEYRNNGIEVSIDDFGTGFSSLSYLKEFDIDYLKIDRSFISQITENESNKALTEAIIVMAHKLGIKTIAEGVETEAQRDLLLEFGCDYLQGYLYSRPVPIEEFQGLLES